MFPMDLFKQALPSPPSSASDMRPSSVPVMDVMKPLPPELTAPSGKPCEPSSVPVMEIISRK